MLRSTHGCLGRSISAVRSSTSSNSACSASSAHVRRSTPRRSLGQQPSCAGVSPAAQQARKQKQQKQLQQRSAGLCCRAVSGGRESNTQQQQLVEEQVNNSASNSSNITSSGSANTAPSTNLNLFGFAASEEATAVAALSASIAVGAVLGSAGLGLDDSLPDSVRHLSGGLGWAYFTCWSISFWPQIVDNHRTRDVSGLSPDYLLYSLVGYVCYAAYTGALCFSSDVRASYATLHGGAMPDVSPADFAFAAHAVLATLLVSGQYYVMRRPSDKALTPVAAGVGLVVLAACGGGAAHIRATCDLSDCASWLPLLVLLGGTKVSQYSSVVKGWRVDRRAWRACVLRERKQLCPAPESSTLQRIPSIHSHPGGYDADQVHPAGKYFTSESGAPSNIGFA